MLNRAEIQRQLPHRDPFVFLDEVTEVDPGHAARGRLILRGDEPYLEGHFPGKPMMPGVLVLEHMAQLAGFVLGDCKDAEQQLVFAGVERARFLRAVVPTAEILTEVTAVKVLPTMALLEATSYVNGEEVARARLQLAHLAPTTEQRKNHDGNDVLATR